MLVGATSPDLLGDTPGCDIVVVVMFSAIVSVHIDLIRNDVSNVNRTQVFKAHPEEVPIVMLLRYRCSLIQRLTQNDPLKDILSKHKRSHHRNLGVSMGKADGTLVTLSGHARRRNDDDVVTYTLE